MTLIHIPTVYNLATPLIARNACRSFSSSTPCKSWLSKLIFPSSEKAGNNSYGSNPSAGNRCFLPIRNDSELNDTLLYSSRTPLLLNFTFRGNPAADLLTGALTRLVQLETEKRINMCDVETDFLETREAMLRFGVKEIPTIVAVRKSLPVDYYTLYEDDKVELNYLRLKAWVEKNAEDV